MGNGGVACVPSQHIMDRFSTCRSKSNGTNNNNKKFTSSTTPSKLVKANAKMKPHKEKGGGELSGKSESKEVESNGDAVSDEIEEGELGTLPVEHEVLVSENPVQRKYEIRSEIEKGDVVVDKWRRGGEAQKSEFANGKWRKGMSRRSEVDKNDRGYELEKGEFVPDDRWRKSEVLAKDDYSYPRPRRYDTLKDKGWKGELEWTPPPTTKDKGLRNDCEWTPPSDKYSGEKEFNKSGGVQHGKRSSRYESNCIQERNPRISSKIVNEEASFKNELSNGKTHAREYSSGNRLKRHGTDSDSSDRKYRGEYDDYSSSKCRKLSDDGTRSTYSTEHYSRRSVERSYRNASSGRGSASERHSSRNYDSSRVARDKNNESPHHSERSPHSRTRHLDYRDRSPARRDRSPYHRGHHDDNSRSPYDRSRHFDQRRSPSYSEWSPQDQARYNDRKDRNPNFLERSPRDHGRSSSYRETCWKSGASEKRESHVEGKQQEEKPSPKDPSGRDENVSVKDSEDRSYPDNNIGSTDKSTVQLIQGEESPQCPVVGTVDSLMENGVVEEVGSMEEDMDICNTPPHAPVAADAVLGKWYYLDQFGVEQGPSNLCNLKTLVEEGFLVSDHFIKHIDSERWVTVENAVSPIVSANFPSIVSETVTQLASPPEAPGNILADNGELSQTGFQPSEYTIDKVSVPALCSVDSLTASHSFEDLHIDERVDALLKGITVIPGRELEAVGEMLKLSFEHGEWERWSGIEGFTWHQSHIGDYSDDRSGEGVSESLPKEPAELRPSLAALSDVDNVFSYTDIDEWFSGHWSCKGGDWKRNDEASQDKSWKKKLVLNDGYPLCQMPKSGNEDPRWHEKDELYYPSQSRRLDLLSWAFTSPDEWNDCNPATRSAQIKPASLRGVRGMVLPVIRINACVVKDHGPFVSESRTKVRAKERFPPRSARPYSVSRDSKGLSEEGFSCKNMQETDSHGTHKSILPLSIPKDHICTADELHLSIGDWYYLDGAGHEKGPFSFSELQVLVDQGVIKKHSSVYRKVDKIWVPVSFCVETHDQLKVRQKNHAKSKDISGATLSKLNDMVGGSSGVLSTFHALHPQFIGFTQGKLHELVMKTYKSRELVAAINEVLDPWISARQPKKELEIFQKSDQFRANKRARIDGSEDEYELDDDILTIKGDECPFEDLCGNATFNKDTSTESQLERQSWGLLDGHVLARVFHFLKADIRSLVYAASACKHWRSVVKFYKDISKQVDLSSVSPHCSDSMISSVMNGYNEQKINSLVLRGCTAITSSMLEDILQSFSSLLTIDIRGCYQFEDLCLKFPNIKWIRSQGQSLKLKSLKNLAETSSRIDESSGLRDYLESSEKRDSANQLFRRSLYKRSKVFDARKSSSIMSRDAHLRRLAMKKSENGYKKMREFLASSLKEIMKENAFDFFVPKVAKIEERIKSGYYGIHGLRSVKEDISRMCHDALKVKNRGDSKGMNRIIESFICLATRLEEGPISFYRHESPRTSKDGSPPGFSSTTSKYRKILNKASEKKYSNGSNGPNFVNGVSDYGEYASDREIKRRLSKLNVKSLRSGSETSDGFDQSSDESMTDSESSASETESDLELRSEGGTLESRGDTYFTLDDGFDSFVDDREWGARMTKASLVPPVTRKYEVIDHYVVVADEKEVKRKMLVSLPEDYDEKLNAQRNGIEESDMEIPEVKDYKPRKCLGDEVIEQEVYGIDPYTHNLLLDSMPEESDWPLLDKHIFIEDVLLRTLNRKVRDFTGSGNTPMIYPLKPVFEVILEEAEGNQDKRTAILCQVILKAIDNRPQDNYVAYRKGLGVVCNKEGGFSQEDFVVEFLGEVYPAWKWFEKQDGIRSLQKNNKDPAPEFYNIYLERPKGDADGYDLVVVDAMHKANYASRICHSCRPNCEAKVTAVDGQYQIGIYTVRPIAFGEEITFDYNSVTESKEEYEASVCLCGSQVCRGSYLNLTGEGAYQKVIEQYHGILDRHGLLLEACELNSVSEEDYIDLGKAGLGSCLLAGLPDWLIAYSARVVRFINLERTKLPDEILRHNLEEKKKYFSEICMEVEKNDAEIQAEGVYNQRLQNLALTLDKVRYVMRCVFDDPKEAPPPLERLSPEAVVSFIWRGEGSLVEELLQCLSPHLEESGLLYDLKAKIRARDPSRSGDIIRELRKSLLWLRDEVRNLPCTYKCRNDAAADLIHIYAHTKCFFRIKEYKTVTSPPVHISPLDLGPKYADKLGPGVHEYCKTYGENYCLGQLIYWHNQANAEPDNSLARASRGCLSLPEVDSFYAKAQKPSRQRVYGPRTVKFMLSRMEKQPQRAWPKDQIWSFKSNPKIVGSPMLDAILHKTSIDRDLVNWLKNRPAIFQATWDR
ncbi:PREDICTED: histone-lysine N-methyltransferase ATXR3 [Ipomoea nil]|uniref:histone-lysine N-methyltransferase ATXR3 n=1 Tax=Ipomoea nil TaxID=35883 RepID=UPI000901E7F8|nr:PREDICTED: histone-lysine N-methyltransferase ATXR3 [Ipomoea nil]